MTRCQLNISLKGRVASGIQNFHCPDISYFCHIFSKTFELLFAFLLIAFFYHPVNTFE